MGGLLSAIIAFVSLVVDYYTTAWGASDLMGPWGVAVSLAVQAVQLLSLIYLHSKHKDDDPPVYRGVMVFLAIITTFLNAFYNLIALYGATGWDDFIRVATSGPDWPIRLAAMATLSVAITTEFESYVSFAISHHSLVSTATLGLPLMLSAPLFFGSILAGLFSPVLTLLGVVRRQGRNYDSLLFEVAIFAIGAWCLRLVDVVSTYWTLFERNNLAGWLAIYSSLLCSAVQFRAIWLFGSGKRPDAFDSIRMLAVTVVNIYGSAVFFASIAPDFSFLGAFVVAIFVCLGVLVSLGSEVVEMHAVKKAIAAAVAQKILRQMSEEEAVRAVAAVVPLTMGSAFVAGERISKPFAMAFAGIGAAFSSVTSGLMAGMMWKNGLEVSAGSATSSRSNELASERPRDIHRPSEPRSGPVGFADWFQRSRGSRGED